MVVRSQYWAICGSRNFLADNNKKLKFHSIAFYSEVRLSHFCKIKLNFWSKYPAPLIPNLSMLEEQEIGGYIQEKPSDTGYM
jgi:hypothetical protein